MRIGLVHEVWPNAELQQRAQNLAEELAEKPPNAVASVLACVVGAEQASLEEAIQVERREVRRASGSAEQREGMQAFMEKRPPRFHDH